MRGDGACARDATTGAAGFVAAGTDAWGGTAGGVVSEVGAAACATGGVAAGEWTGGAGTGIAGSVPADAGGGATAGGGTENVGRGVADGTTILGATTAELGGGGAFTVETGGAAGVAAATGRTEGGATVAGACCFRIAFRTSPGLEILERSILVLISSLSTRLGRDCREEVWASLAERKYARTFSASCSSTELECVFFSVTPTSGSASRIALLLTSSSLARSLIRILLIRPFFPPDSPAKSSYQPHGVGFRLRASQFAQSA